MTKLKNNIIEILIFFTIFLLLFYSSDPVIYDDSSRYLEGGLKGPPLYSIIVLTLKSIFKTLNSIIIFQTIFLGFSIAFFTKTVSEHFNLNGKDSNYNSDSSLAELTPDQLTLLINGWDQERSRLNNS